MIDFVILVGVSGLTLGYELKKGNSFLFRSKRFAGLNTIKYKSFPIDLVHMFFILPFLVKALESLVEQAQRKKLYSGNFIDGSFYDYPINKKQ